MTVEELIKILQKMPAEAEVRLAQEAYISFEHSLSNEVIESMDGKIVYITRDELIGCLPNEINAMYGWY